MKTGLTIKAFQGMFFDRALVEGKIDAATAGTMSRFGSYVRRSARQNFRGGKAKRPEPPKPRNKSGKLRTILFGWDAAARSVVVGPVLFPSTKDRSHPPTEKVERGGIFPVVIHGQKKTGRYREFPFMRNALTKELPKLPTLWVNAIR